MTLAEADSEPGMVSAGENTKAIVNPFIIITAVIIVSLVEYFYLASGLYWDPVIAIIPLLAVLIPVGYYIDRKIQKINTDGKKRSATLWMIVFILIICSRVIQVIDDYDIYSFKIFSFLLKVSLVILALVLAFIWIHNRAQESVPPSEESYHALLKLVIAVLIINVVVIAGCFVLGSIFGGQVSLLFVVLAVPLISVWYFVGKMRSLGFAS
jgi:hypothetical protein